MAKAISLQIQKAEQTPKEQTPKFMPRHIIIIIIIINFLKNKDRKNLESSEREMKSIRGKQFELLQISHQKQWKPENIVVFIQRMLCHILLVSMVLHHGKNCQPRILYPEKYHSEMKRKLRHFQMKEAKQIWQQQTYPKSLAKGSY